MATHPSLDFDCIDCGYTCDGIDKKTIDGFCECVSHRCEPDFECDICGDDASCSVYPYAHLFDAAAYKSHDYIKPPGGIKHDSEKPRMDLLPFEALEEVAKALTYGAKKYDAKNWRKGMAWSRFLAATLRHVFAWASGERKDSETGLSHLTHAACCLLFLITYEVKGLGHDDISE